MTTTKKIAIALLALALVGGVYYLLFSETAKKKKLANKILLKDDTQTKEALLVLTLPELEKLAA